MKLLITSNNIKTSIKYTRTLISIIAALCLWHILYTTQVINPLFLPGPFDTMQKGIDILSSGYLIKDIFFSFYRIFIGLTLALVAGIPAGFFVGYYASFYNYTHWIVDFFRSIPPILIFPLSLLIFGTGDQSRIAVIFFGTVFIIILYTSKGIMNVSPVRIHAAKTIGAGTRHIFLNVLIYDSLPGIFIGLRTSLSMSIIIGLVTEMLVGTQFGLGSRIIYAQTSYATEEMYFIIILVGAIGLIANRIMVKAEKKIIHWNKYN